MMSFKSASVTGRATEGVIDDESEGGTIPYAQPQNVLYDTTRYDSSKSAKSQDSQIGPKK